MKKNGFTLVEVLATLAVFGIVMVVANQVLFGTLKSSTKSELQSKVKQEAQNALSTVEREFRNSRGLGACSGISVGYKDTRGKDASLVCVAPNTASGQIQWNRLKDDNSLETIPLTPNDVALTSCTITCDLTARSVSIDISLQDRNSFTVPTGRPEDKAIFSAKTRVLLRN